MWILTKNRGRGVLATWVVALAVATCTGFFVANEPLMQVTDCEVINASSPSCQGNVSDYYGLEFSVRAYIIAAACMVALIVRNPAVSITACIAVGCSMIGAGFAWYYIPTVLVAISAAAYQIAVSRQTGNSSAV